MNKVFKKLFLVFIFLIYANINFASELSFICNFEEVHSNGSTNQGLVLYDRGKLRYEYFNEDLFIIFINKKGIFLHNKKNQSSKPLNNNLKIINYLIKIAHMYPEIPEKIDEKGVSIKITKNSNKTFVKRVSIDSNQARLSLYFNSCDLNVPINDLFFKEKPIFNYR